MSNYVLYVKNSCPYCHSAVDLLEEKGLGYNIISVDASEQLFESVKEAYEWQTVPMIFFKTNDKTYKFVGGFDNLKESLNV